MARNGSGVYSLPAGYLAITGQTIQAAQHNTPLEDIAADLNAAIPAYRLNANLGAATLTPTQGSAGTLANHLGSMIAAYADVASITIPNDTFRTSGYATKGDGGGGLYVRRVSEPSHPGKVRDAGNAWFELVPDPVINVRQFGAKGDDATDDLTAFRNAELARQSLGGVLFIPPGIYRISDQIVMETARGRIYGAGDRSHIKTTSATADVFQVDISFAEIDNLRISSTVTRSGGYYIDIASSVARVDVHHFLFENALTAIRTEGTATITIAHGRIFDSVLATGVAIRVDDGFDVSVRDIIVDQGGELFAGILITKCADISIEDCQIINAGQCIYAQIGTGDVLASLWVNNTFCDNGTRGIFLDANGGTIVRALIDQTWCSSNINDGVFIRATSGGTIDGVDFTGCHIFDNGATGFAVEGAGTVNIRVSDSVIAGNTGDAVTFGLGVGSFSLQSCRIGATHGFGANARGIVLGGTNDNYIISNNDLRGNTTGPLVGHAATTTRIAVDNLGAATRATLTVSGSTDSSGDVVIAHGLIAQPSRAWFSVFGGAARVAQLRAVSASDMTIRVFDMAGNAVASTAIDLYVQVEI